MSESDRTHAIDWSRLTEYLPLGESDAKSTTASGAESTDERGSKPTDATNQVGTAEREGKTQDGLWTRLQRISNIVSDSSMEYQPYRPGVDDPLATVALPDTETEVDRYWVNAPFAYTVITYDKSDSEHRYRTVEPDLDKFESGLLDRVRRDIRSPLLYGDNEESNGTATADRNSEPTADRDSEPAAGETLTTELLALIERYGISVDSRTLHALWYYLDRDFRGYGRLDPLLQDDRVEDISCDGYDLPVFIYHETYTDIETDIAFEATALDDFVVRLAQQAGQHLSVAEPLVEATLPDGSRAELTLGEAVTPRGSAFTIRQYAAEPFTPIDLLEYGTFNAAQLAYCWLCIEHNKSLLFAGGTAAGKTTSLNAVSMFIPGGSKVITIEDTRELAFAHDNWLAAVTREAGTDGTGIDMYDLLRSALRHRPEYLVVGEVRGAEAETLFQAMNTGHTTLSTIHADSIETVVTRLENDPINVPRAMVQSVDLVSVQTQRRLDGRRVRRAGTIGEIRGIDGRTGELDFASAFEWEPHSDSFTRKESDLLDDIRAERGWDRGELRRELRDRERFLTGLQDHGVTDYRAFTALVEDYYADSEAVLDRIETAEDGDTASLGVAESTSTNANGADSRSAVGFESDEAETQFDPNTITNHP
jgi:flagellar protein FlaI